MTKTAVKPAVDTNDRIAQLEAALAALTARNAELEAKAAKGKPGRVAKFTDVPEADRRSADTLAGMADHAGRERAVDASIKLARLFPTPALGDILADLAERVAAEGLAGEGKTAADVMTVVLTKVDKPRKNKSGEAAEKVVDDATA